MPPGGCFGPWSARWPPTRCGFYAVPMCPSRWRARSVSASVLTPASSEPRPWGASKACLRTGGSCCCLWASGSTGCRTIGVEVGVLDPHPMQDDTDAAGQRDPCPLRPKPAGNLCRPCSEPSRAATTHHDGGRLAQGAPKIDIACLGDPARDIALTRLVSRGCEADPRPSLLRGGEPAGVIHRGSIGQCDHRAHAGHRHHAATRRVLLGKMADATFQPGQLLSERQSRPKPRMARRRFPDALFRLATRQCADPEAEAAKPSTQGHFQRDEPLLHGLARAQHRANLLC
jgi:hypothetical protein